MREIEIVPGAAPKFMHILLSGLSGSGKTYMAASAPKPLFIADAVEGGYNTLTSMPPELWWDPKVRPKAWIIETYTDMGASLTRLEAMAANKSAPFPFETIVIDPFTVYIDRYLSEMMAKELYKDNRKYYGDLAAHIQALVRRFHALPCHVIWCCHLKHDGSDVNGPHIGGQMSEKFPAYCDFKWMTRAVGGSPQTAATWELRTKPFQSWTFLGGRYELWDPMISSMKCVMQVLGYQQRPVSPAVPGYPLGVTYPPPPAPGAIVQLQQQDSGQQQLQQQQQGSNGQ